MGTDRDMARGMGRRHVDDSGAAIKHGIAVLDESAPTGDGVAAHRHLVELAARGST